MINRFHYLVANDCVCVYNRTYREYQKKGDFSMAKNANLYIRVDQGIKDQAEEIFSNFGITVTDAVNMFLYKVIMVGGLPFDVRIPTPNTETLEALKEVEQMKKDPSLGKSYTNVDEMMKELLQ